jgi:saccharopine dehydrogenase-like NADP-dependent oxidoreductase
MNTLVLGLGLQGKATVHDLERSDGVDRIVVADLDRSAVAAWLAARGYRKCEAAELDAAADGAVESILGVARPDVVVCMLPAAFGYQVARAAISAGVPFVSTSYTGRLAELDGEARAAGVTVLPEMGFDPGIDLLLARCAIDELDELEGLRSYGSGIPEPRAADNPLKYKITWTFDGVLGSYMRDARLLRGGRTLDIPGREIFRADHLHLVEVPDVGTLEAYPNGDARQYIARFGIEGSIRDMGRYAMRWPGHGQIWYALSQLGFLDDSPITVSGASVSPRRFLVELLSPRLQFRPEERDIAILRVDAWGRADGRPRRVVYDLIDYRDLETGFFAMNRTVGFMASVAAQMVAAGKIAGPGVLSPARDVPPRPVLDALSARGIRIARHLLAAPAAPGGPR